MAELFVNEIVSIGAVTDGDNPESKIMLFKRRNDKPDPTIVDPTKKKEKPSTESAGNGSHPMSILDEMDLDPDALAKIQEYVDNQITEAVEKAKAETDPEPDPLQKASPEVQAMVQKQAEQIETLRKQHEVEVQHRRNTEFATIAKQYAPVTGKADEAAAHLDALEKGAPDAFKWLKERLEIAKKVISESNLLKEFGTGDDGDVAVDDAVKVKVAELRKANPELTVAAARSQVWRENPELVEAAREGR